MREAFYDHDGLRLYLGDALATLRELPGASADMALTSPPFFALRDYQTGTWEGGDEACDHAGPPAGGPRTPSTEFRATEAKERRSRQYRDVCARCGARRVDEQVGLEETPDAYVERLVGIFREVRRVLRPHGCLLLELGDSYSAGTRGSYAGDGDRPQTKDRPQVAQTKGGMPRSYPTRPLLDLPGKNLLGMPWRLAFALQADGWILRGAYIWSKPNAMPESMRDRCTTAHSHVFHFAMSDRYFWDGEAIREEAVARTAGSWSERMHNERNRVPAGKNGTYRRDYEPPAGRNARSVWTIPTEPQALAICPVCHAFWERDSPDVHCGVDVVGHFAAFPPALAERAIAAASSERGVCPACGKPHVRIVEKGEPELAANTWSPTGAGQYDTDSAAHAASAGSTLKHVRANRTIGWEPTCSCGLEPVPATVLDPFCGAGTALLSARRLGRRAVGIELSEHYAWMSALRLRIPDRVAAAAATSADPVQLVLG